MIMRCQLMNRGVDGQPKIQLQVQKRSISLLKRLFPLFLIFLVGRQDVVVLLTLLILRKRIRKTLMVGSMIWGSIEDTFKRHLRGKLGCLCVPVAFYGIYEAQSRMALHVHALFWTLLNAELLSQYTQKDLRRICLLIDQLIATWISESDVIKEQEFKKKHKSVRSS